MEADEEPPDCPVGERPDVLDVVSGAPLALDEIIEECLPCRDQPGTVGEVILPHFVHQTLLSEALHLHLAQPLPEDPGDEAVAGVEDVPGGLTVQDVGYLDRVEHSRSEII